MGKCSRGVAGAESETALSRCLLQSGTEKWVGGHQRDLQEQGKCSYGDRPPLEPGHCVGGQLPLERAGTVHLWGQGGRADPMGASGKARRHVASFQGASLLSGSLCPSRGQSVRDWRQEVWKESVNCQPGEQEGENMRKIRMGSIKGSHCKQNVPRGPGPTRAAGGGEPAATPSSPSSVPF